jgi:hypothetical protein
MTSKETEKYTNTQQLFLESLNGPNQSMTDKLYNELCDNVNLETVPMTNIKGDPQTLLMLAENIKSSREAQVNCSIKSNMLNTIINGNNIDTFQKN